MNGRITSAGKVVGGNGSWLCLKEIVRILTCAYPYIIRVGNFFFFFLEKFLWPLRKLLALLLLLLDFFLFL